MRKILLVLILLPELFSGCSKQIHFPGNQVFPGWYADPEGTIYNNKYWIFPTYSDGTLFHEITPQGYVKGRFMFIRNGKYYYM